MTQLAAVKLAGPASVIGLMTAWAVLWAAPLDALENLAILRLLDGEAASPWPQLSTVCASIKFALVLGGLGYTFVAGGLRIVQCWRH